MKITRSLSIDLDVWSRATDFSRRRGMPFSVFVEHSLVEEMKREPQPDLTTDIKPPEVLSLGTLGVERERDD